MIVAPSGIWEDDPCGLPKDVSKLSCWFLLLLHLPQISVCVCVCVCVLLHPLTVCRVHATSINTPFHESPHMTSRSVPMHRGGQLPLLSSWGLVVLPRCQESIWSCHSSRKAGQHSWGQATPACSGAQLQGSRRRKPFFFFKLSSSKQALPLKAFFCVCTMKWKEIED